MEGAFGADRDVETEKGRVCFGMIMFEGALRATRRFASCCAAGRDIAWGGVRSGVERYECSVE